MDATVRNVTKVVIGEVLSIRVGFFRRITLQCSDGTDSHKIDLWADEADALKPHQVEEYFPI